MTDKIKLDGTLIPVGREIRAKPGQYLIVAAGVCIGVYTGDSAIPVAPKVIEHEPASIKKKNASRVDTDRSKHRSQSRSGSGLTVRGEPIRTVQPVVDALRAYFKSHEEAKVVEIREALGETLVGSKAWRLRDALAYLAKQGELRATGKSTDRMYHRVGRKAA